ncbi:hypothetical protein GF380_05815 [Candidatus Uhrbacteria bacterium]|nr:hypothetical protein [Candidatus Uhrbacteria bacterium]MBD3284508.1 hypothetical protein [Candidatus Uhrbacteria bacterium]
MKASFKKGLGFGITSGVITTLGLIVGLNAGTSNRSIVISGILIMAIADSLSDSLGIHVSEEANKVLTQRQVWEATGAALLSKVVIAGSFMIPVLLIPLSTAIAVCITWGLVLVIGFSWYIAKTRNEKPFWIIAEHVVISVLVVLATDRVGTWLHT